MSSTTNDRGTLPIWRYVWYCHALPERSLRWSGMLLPICARCTGLWLGYVCATLAAWFWLLPWWISLLCIAPLVLDGGTQALGLRQSNNRLRLATGFVAGIGEIMFIVWALSYSFLLGQLVGTRLVS